MNFDFLFKTALRDSRKDRGRLFLFMSSIILGVTALVAINSFNYNLVKDIDRQAKTLLGADLVVTGNKPTTESLNILLDSLPSEDAMEMELFSMAYIPKNGETQFVRIKALEGDFPFYGNLKTENDGKLKLINNLGFDFPEAILLRLEYVKLFSNINIFYNNHLLN